MYRPTANNALGLCLLLLSSAPFSGSVDTANTTVAQEVTAKPEEKKDKLGGYNILPIPIIISEPAIGEGLGVALALFHPSKGQSESIPRVTTPGSIVSPEEDPRKPPPIVTGVFGAYTSSKTWAAGVGHMNNWRDDHIRYKGALATAEVNSTFYRGGLPVDYTLNGDLVFQDIKFRVVDSDFFLGASFSYLMATNRFKLSLDNLPASILDTEIRNVGMAATATYDTRDNTMNPNEGQLVDLGLWRYDEAIGGNYNYWSTTLKALSFHQLYEQFTLGLRLDVSAVDGRPPFFGYPWVKLRGIPAMRYQDERAGAVEVEGRYQIAQKWEVLGFAGLGFTSGSTPFFDNPDDIYNVGAGIRYKLLREHNVWGGVDAARGPEKWYWYIQVGHAW